MAQDGLSRSQTSSANWCVCGESPATAGQMAPYASFLFLHSPPFEALHRIADGERSMQLFGGRYDITICVSDVSNTRLVCRSSGFRQPHRHPVGFKPKLYAFKTTHFLSKKCCFPSSKVNPFPPCP